MNASKTPAGHTETQASPEQIEAINQIFELFRFNYHNQFLKAFPDLERLNTAKRLWLKLLNGYTYHTIMSAGEKTIKEHAFLPTLSDVIARCDQCLSTNMPDAYQAYIEACRASSPKAKFNWSHPAVYYAGRASDWFFLANTPERQAFAVFKRNYEELLKRVGAGEDIRITIPKALEDIPKPKASQEEARQQFDKIKALFN